MSKIVYKRCCLTLDLGTIRKCKELANDKGQTVSSLIRYIVGQIYEEAVGPKRIERSGGRVRAARLSDD